MRAQLSFAVSFGVSDLTFLHVQIVVSPARLTLPAEARQLTSPSCLAHLM